MRIPEGGRAATVTAMLRASLLISVPQQDVITWAFSPLKYPN